MVAPRLEKPAGSKPRPLCGRRLDDLPGDGERVAVDDRAQRDVAALLLGQPGLAHERHGVRRSLGVGARHGAGPQVGDRPSGSALAGRVLGVDAELLLVGVLAYARVEVADARPCALDPAATVLADVVRERGTEALRVLEHALLDQVRDRVELDAVASQPSRSASSGIAPPPANMVEHLRRDAAVGVEDALAGLGDDAVGGAPLAQGGEEGGVARVVGRVVRSARASRRRRRGRRPAVGEPTTGEACAGGSAAWPIFSRWRDRVDGLDGEVVLDQPPVVASCACLVDRFAGHEVGRDLGDLLDAVAEDAGGVLDLDAARRVAGGAVERRRARRWGRGGGRRSTRCGTGSRRRGRVRGP